MRVCKLVVSYEVPVSASGKIDIETMKLCDEFVEAFAVFAAGAQEVGEWVASGCGFGGRDLEYEYAHKRLAQNAASRVRRAAKKVGWQVTCSVYDYDLQ